jgi:enediyne biosynthesis protein E4
MAGYFRRPLKTTAGWANCVFVSVALVGMGHAQDGHTRPTAPPPSATKKDCTGRPVPQFTDVTKSAGVTFRHTSDPSKKYILESMSGGVLLLDYDRDGWLDIYFTNAPTVAMAIAGKPSPGALYRNNHDGTFTDVTQQAGLMNSCFAMGGAVGDYDNNGWPDIYLTCIGGNILYQNNGNGSFTDVTARAGVRDGRWSTGAAFGDYDGDGFVDLMVTNYVDFKLDDLPKFGGAPNCQYRGMDVQCGPRGLKGAGDSLFHNNGDGTFTDVSKAAGVDDPAGYYGLGVLWSDLNNTGHPDIYIANDSTPKFLYKNDGHGHFEDIGLVSGTALSAEGSEQASMGLAVGDYTHSGRQSVYVTNFSEENDVLFRNEGNWNFTEQSYPAGVAVPSFPFVKWGTAFGDFDNDGWLDLIAVTGHVYPQVDEQPDGARYREPGLFLLNQKDGSFCDASTLTGDALAEKRVSRGLAIGDLFNNGNLDAVIGNLDGSPAILKNAGVPGEHWVSFELAGTKSNRMALNARVHIVAKGVSQVEEIHSGGSYLSQNDTRVHFGLGDANAIESVEVTWPSGKVDRMKNLAGDKFYFLLEGKGLVSPDKVRPAKLKP